MTQLRNTDHVRTHNHSLVHPFLDHAMLQKNEAGRQDAPGAPSSVFGASSASTTVLCNFNTVAKMEPVMYRVSHPSPHCQPTTLPLTLSPPLRPAACYRQVWLDILARSPHTVLWLLSPKGKMGEITSLTADVSVAA